MTMCKRTSEIEIYLLGLDGILASDVTHLSVSPLSRLIPLDVYQ